MRSRLSRAGTAAQRGVASSRPARIPEITISGCCVIFDSAGRPAGQLGVVGCLRDRLQSDIARIVSYRNGCLRRYAAEPLLGETTIHSRSFQSSVAAARRPSRQHRNSESSLIAHLVASRQLNFLPGCSAAGRLDESRLRLWRRLRYCLRLGGGSFRRGRRRAARARAPCHQWNVHSSKVAGEAERREPKEASAEQAGDGWR